MGKGELFTKGLTYGGFPGGSDGKDSACNAADPGLISGSGRSSGGVHGSPLQFVAWRIPWTEESADYNLWSHLESDMTEAT